LLRVFTSDDDKYHRIAAKENKERPEFVSIDVSHSSFLTFFLFFSSSPFSLSHTNTNKHSHRGQRFAIMSQQLLMFSTSYTTSITTGAIASIHMLEDRKFAGRPHSIAILMNHAVADQKHECQRKEKKVSNTMFVTVSITRVMLSCKNNSLDRRSIVRLPFNGL
jgi:hypothetical protein